MSYAFIPARYVPNANSNARIQTRTDRSGKTRTETARRTTGIDVAASTDNRGSTRLFLDNADFDNNGDVVLTGQQARTLYRVLRRHFRSVGKSIAG